MSSNRVIDGVPGGQRRSYVTTDIFTDYFYTYRTEVQDTEVVGVWGKVTSDSSLCPKGRILRENGRKLYPGANPGVASYYVGVYDDKTFLSGFIDPNARVFTPYNNNMPVYLSTDYAEDDGEPENGDVSSVQNLGEPIYTRGRIETTNGDIIADDNDGENYISLQNDISGGSAAYFGTDGSQRPYVYVQSCDSTTYGYMQATPDEALVELSAQNGGGVALYASDGSIYNAGVLHPYNACGTVSVSSGAGTTTNNLLREAGTLVLLTRQSGGSNYGHLSYSIVDNVLHVYSTSNTESSTVNYLIVSTNN
jgi:hypothetical protein